MAEQSGSVQFQAVLESALRTYEKSVGITLCSLEHPLAVQLQSCHSVDDMTALLQDQALQTVDDFRQRHRIVKSIKATVSTLIPVSFGVSDTNNVGHTLFAPAKTLTAILGILLDAVNGVITSHDTLADMLESIERFMNCIKIYTETPPMHEIDEIVVKLMVELITTLSLTTEKLRKRRALTWVKSFFGVKDVNAARRRLDRVMKEESQTVAALTPGLVDGVVKDIMKFVDDGNASADGVRKVSDRTMLDVNGSSRLFQLSIGIWLSPPDPWNNYHIGRGFRHSGTGTWFVKGITFSEWKASEPGSLLWINGKPGAGKTVLCSRIIDEIETLRNSGLASLAMYFYDFREDGKKDLRGPALFCGLSALRPNPSNDELVRCLMDLLKLPGSPLVYLIVDALDECPSTSSLSSPREEVLSLLEDLVEAQLPNLRICVTSRPEVDIKAILEPLAFRSVSLHAASGQQEDIRNYIKSAINTNKKMQNWNSEHKQLAIEVLTRKTDMTFGWAHCQIKYLASCQQDRIRDVLDELPATLDETYERTLRKIEETDWEFARRVLLCVAAASRPLRVDELAEILAFDFEAGPIPKFREDWRAKNPVEALLSACSTMLSVPNNRKSNLKPVQLAHFSAIEFLMSTRLAETRDNISRRYHISMTSAHTVIVQACLGVLLHLDKDVTRDSLTKFPFAIYAAEHWFEHARFGGVSKNVEEGMKQLFDRMKPHLSIWIWICDPTTPEPQNERPERPFPSRGTPLHYAAFCGLRDVVEVLAIEHPEDVNSRSFENEGTPLHLASHVGVAEFLVEHGADTEVQDKDGRTPLHLASVNGQVDLARMLVEHSAKLAAQDNDGSTPLHLASQYGHVGLAQTLMKYDADVAAHDNDGRTPLHLALVNDHVGLARMLVEHDANAAAKDKDSGTPLHLASLNGHVDLARTLVEHGADVTAQDKDGRTPLHLASDKGHEELALVLVACGADVAFQDSDGKTPLHLASEQRHEDLAWMLVEHGADLTAQDKDGRSPLHLASSLGHTGLVQMLVENGADVAAQDEAGRTPLHLSLACGGVRIARMLVEYGADGKIQDKAGETSLHLASYNGHMDIALMFLEQGANVAARDEHGSTPLHCASLRGCVKLARMLIGHGADVAAQDNGGNTPLHYTSKWGHVNFARMLVEHGADMAAQDENGSTPLHLVSHKGLMDVAQMLVEHGADVTAQNKDGITPLHEASFYGHIDLARMLIEHGADVAAQDKDGRSPLHWALDQGCADFAQMLIKHGANSAAQGALRIEQSSP